MAPGQKPSIAMVICAAAAKRNSPEDYVELHNAARAAAGAGPVAWDEEVARHAGARAAAGCGGRRGSSAPAAGAYYGENLFRGASGKGWAAADAVRAWTAPAAREHVQVAWPGSTKIGCARAVCGGDRGVVISCSYEPAVKEDLRGQCYQGIVGATSVVATSARFANVFP